MQKERILITGGCGFIGHHFIEHILKNTDWEIVVLDKLTYASNGFDRLRDIGVFDDKRIRLFTSDITLPMQECLAEEIDNIGYIVHMAAETHVDRSITDPIAFITTNVLGTGYVLEYAKTLPNLKKFVYFSTDEVFGPALEGTSYKEWDRYNSTNPYSATKAGAEELCLAYANCYQLPMIITHTMNNFGERQHPEKYIPSTINKVIYGEKVIVHSDSTKKKAGTRFYIHARNTANAILWLLDKGNSREKYNIVGEMEVDNLTLAKTIARIIGKPLRYEMIDFHSSRPGHDLRYALDGTKMADLGWKPPLGFETSLEKTIKWYIDHPKWLLG